MRHERSDTSAATYCSYLVLLRAHTAQQWVSYVDLRAPGDEPEHALFTPLQLDTLLGDKFT